MILVYIFYVRSYEGHAQCACADLRCNVIGSYDMIVKGDNRVKCVHNSYTW